MMGSMESAESIPRDDRDEAPPLGHGLELFGVFDTSMLASEIRDVLERDGIDLALFPQLLLVGHVGKELWSALETRGIRSADPIDDFTVEVVDSYFAKHQPEGRYRILYPASGPMLSLQALGALAGLGHASPFFVGIDDRWGTWFAYRAVVLADTRFRTTEPRRTESPCSLCEARFCERSCPSGAIDGEVFDLQRCLAYRREPDSRCRETCVARTSCPVGSAYRYDEPQLRYHYGRSLRTILAMSRSDGAG